MGLFGRLFGHKGEAPPPADVYELELKDVEGLLGEKDEAFRDGARAELGSLIKEIMDARKDILEAASELEERDFPEEIKARVPKPVLTAKPKYIKGMRDAMGSIRVEEDSMEGYRSFHSRFLKTMKVIQKTQVGQGRFVAHSFEGDVLRIGGVLNRLVGAAGRMGEVILDAQGKETAFRDAISQAVSLMEIAASICDRKDDVSSYETEIKEMEEDEKKAVDRITELEGSRGYEYLRGLMEELDGLRGAREGVRTEVFRRLSPLGRVLRKYRKLVEGTSEEKDIDRYLKDPAGAFFEGVPLSSILGGLDRAMKGGHIPLKDKEKDKSMARLGEATGTDFEALRAKYDDLGRKIEDMRACIKGSSVGSEIASLKDRVARSEAGAARARADLAQTLEEVPELEERLQEGVEGLRSRLEGLLNGDVRLSL